MSSGRVLRSAHSRSSSRLARAWASSRSMIRPVSARVPETEAPARFAENPHEVGRLRAGQPFAELQVTTHHPEQFGAGLPSCLDQALGHRFAKDAAFVAHGGRKIAAYADGDIDRHGYRPSTSNQVTICSGFWASRSNRGLIYQRSHASPSCGLIQSGERVTHDDVSSEFVKSVLGELMWARLLGPDQNIAQRLHLLQAPPGSKNHAGQGVNGYRNRQARG